MKHLLAWIGIAIIIALSLATVDYARRQTQ